MDMEPAIWNVVCAGRWNTAIFTPEWIRRRLFELESQAMVQVSFSLNEALPHRVTLQDVTVVVTPANLILEPRQPNYVQLDAARKVAALALSALPETPVSAAGYNIRYHVDSLSPDVVQSLTPRVDEKLSDANYTIGDRVLKRSLVLSEGVLNLAITLKGEGPAELEFNFHCGSSDRDVLVAWLSKPVEEIRSVVQRITEEVLELGTMNEENADHD